MFAGLELGINLFKIRLPGLAMFAGPELGIILFKTPPQRPIILASNYFHEFQ